MCIGMTSSFYVVSQYKIVLVAHVSLRNSEIYNVIKHLLRVIHRLVGVELYALLIKNSCKGK